MGETPKTREELIDLLFQGHPTLSYRGAKAVLETLEANDLRIVPAELPHGYFDATKDAMASAYKDMGDIWENVYRAAISASPFAPEQGNG